MNLSYKEKSMLKKLEVQDSCFLRKILKEKNNK